MRVILLCCIALVSLPIKGNTAVAQNRCAGIEGRATSIQGWLIPAAIIRFIDKATKRSSTIKTDANGEYSACLESGIYDLVATAMGYKVAKRKSIKVEGKGRTMVDLVMK